MLMSSNGTCRIKGNASMFRGGRGRSLARRAERRSVSPRSEDGVRDPEPDAKDKRFCP